CEREGLGVRVALKMASGASPEALARFRAEERHLARLEHPHIPRLYDVGTARNGEPYLVMEYAEGAPITEHGDRHGLDLRQRLRLFRQLCDAVDHAHARRVVHRDLKPGNVLVVGIGDEARVKLIDFGVARRLDPFPTFDTKQLAASSDGASRNTASDEDVSGDGADRDAPEVAPGPLAPMTPAYAAPEQRAGQSVGVGADLYALGCLLFEYVAGRPLCADGAAPRATPEVFPRTLKRRVRRDLAAVVARATAPEAADRYSSVSELARDVDRLREGTPVEARSRGPLARAALRVPRRAVWLVLGGCVLVSAGGLAARSIWPSTPPSSSALLYSSIITSLVAEIVRDAPEGEAPEDLLARLLDRIGPEAARYEVVEADLAHLLASSLEVNGRCEDASPLFAHAVDVRRFETPRHPGVGMGLLGRARCISNQASPLRIDGLSAVELAEEGIEILTETYGARSPIVTVAQLDLGHAWDAAGEVEKGITISREAYESLRDSDVQASAREVALVHRQFDDWLIPGDAQIDDDWMLNRRSRALMSLASSYRYNEKFDKAAAVLDAELSQIHAAMRDRGWLDESLVWSYFNWASSLRSQGKWEEAEIRYRQWADAAEERFGPESWITAEARSSIGSLALSRGQWTQAVELYGPLVEDAEALGDSSHLSLMLRRRAYALRKDGQPEPALRDVRRALSFGPDQMRPAIYMSLHADLAEVLLDLGQSAEALNVARRGSELAETVGGSAPARSIVGAAHARALVANGYPRQGLTLAQEALAEAESRPESPSRSRALARAWAIIATAQADLGNAKASGEAEALAERLMAEGRPS
ncbi:MAG: serine/threonine-protein kinase, partial [Bacteroidota bacterium]